jgi:anti-sigma factor RsiW
MEKRDRFELLSAYLDGEVTSAERRQVEEWLVNDSHIKCLYARLLKLRQGLQTIPVPTVSQSPEIAVNQVFNRLDRRYQLVCGLSGTALVACVIGALSGLIIPSNQSPNLQMAAQMLAKPVPVAVQPTVTLSPLMVAINNPVIEIPKTAISPDVESTFLDQESEENIH